MKGDPLLNQHEVAMENPQQSTLVSDSWFIDSRFASYSFVADLEITPSPKLMVLVIHGQGCGRQVAPGTTKRGKPFDTCCRGCVMGFGHDMTCGHLAGTSPLNGGVNGKIALLIMNNYSMGFCIAMFGYQNVKADVPLIGSNLEFLQNECGGSKDMQQKFQRSI